MEVQRLPTVDEMVPWMRIGHAAVAAAQAIGKTAAAIRLAVADVYTAVPVGIYYHPGHEKVALCEHPQITFEDRGALSEAICKVAGVSSGLYRPEDLDNWGWIKVAYSPFLRRTGELLNFFPGKYPGGLPNSPGPVQSMLTSGLVGAGLGYGAGWLGEQLMPNGWERGRLRRNMAVVGGLAGVAPGALWGMANKSIGRNFADPELLNSAPDATPKLDPREMAMAGKAAAELPWETGKRYAAAREHLTATMEEELTKLAAPDTFAAPAHQRQPSTMDVDVDAMGRTLWETGASPDLAGTTMGALYAAGQMPGGDRPGFVTPLQMANYAANMGAGYVSGALVGSALGLLTGMPDRTQNLLRQTGMYTGLVRAIIPRLFGGEQ